MPQGICKLCQKSKDLQNSHLIPAAIYKYLRAPSKKNPNPVVAGRRVSATSSKQMADFLLCADCEDLFNKNGERYVLALVSNGKGFPLGERLALSLEHYPFYGFQSFSGTAVGIDTQKLGYFALSVVWRAAVHQWDMPFGGKTTVLHLGQSEESTRRYLHEETGFPSDVAVVATACTDNFSKGAFFAPSRVSNFQVPCFVMLTLGIHFMVYTGPAIHPVLQEACCVRSPARLIFQRDCTQKTIEAFRSLTMSE